MDTNKQSKWAEHHKRIKNIPPRPLLIKAMQYVEEKSSALDLGAGAFTDSEYLVSQGFGSVTAVDIEPSVKEIAHSDSINVVVSSFEDMNLTPDAYNLVSSQFSLPFVRPSEFDGVMQKIHTSLKKNGIFIGQLFGDKDEWFGNPKMTFHTVEEAQKQFTEYTVIQLEEKERDNILANGKPKHWHQFDFIVKKQ